MFSPFIFCIGSANRHKMKHIIQPNTHFEKDHSQHSNTVVTQRNEKSSTKCYAHISHARAHPSGENRPKQKKKKNKNAVHTRQTYRESLLTLAPALIFNASTFILNERHNEHEQFYLVGCLLSFLSCVCIRCILSVST